MSTSGHETYKAHPFFETLPSTAHQPPEVKISASSLVSKPEEPSSSKIPLYFRKFYDVKSGEARGSNAVHSATYIAALRKEAEEWAKAQGIRSRKDLQKILAADKESRRKPDAVASTAESSFNDTVPKFVKKKHAKIPSRPPNSSLARPSEPQPPATPSHTTSFPTTSTSTFPTKFTAPGPTPSTTLVTLAAVTLTKSKGTQLSLPPPGFRTKSGLLIINAAQALRSQSKQSRSHKRRGHYGYQRPGHSPLRNAIAREPHSHLGSSKPCFEICTAVFHCQCHGNLLTLNLYNPVPVNSCGTPMTQGGKIEPPKSPGIIQHAKPLRYSKIAGPVFFQAPGSKHSHITLRAPLQWPLFKISRTPRRDLITRQLIALPAYQGFHAPTSATLLGLPYFVRIAILERVLVARRDIRPYYCEGSIEMPHTRPEEQVINYNTAVLRVNRQLHQEASRVLYIGNTFVLTNPHIAKWWTKRIGGNVKLLYAVLMVLTTGVTDLEVNWEEHWASFFLWLGPRHHLQVFSVNFEAWRELKLTPNHTMNRQIKMYTVHTSELTMNRAARSRVFIVDLLSKMRGFREVSIYTGDFMSRNAGRNLLECMMAAAPLQPVDVTHPTENPDAEDRMEGVEETGSANLVECTVPPGPPTPLTHANLAALQEAMDRMEGIERTKHGVLVRPTGTGNRRRDWVRKKGGRSVEAVRGHRWRRFVDNKCSF